MSTVRGWQLTVDWSGGGGLTGPLEDVTNYVNREMVTASWGRPVDQVELTTPASELAFQLINRTRTWDRYFSPENASSPIAGKIYPGKQVTLTRTVRSGAVLSTESWSVAGTNGWTAVSGGTVSRVTTPSEDTTGSLQYVPPGAVATVGVTRALKTNFMLEPSGGIVITMRVFSNTAWSDIAAVADWYDQSGTLVGTSTVNTTSIPVSTWTNIDSGTLIPPTTAVSVVPRLRVGSTPPNTIQLNIDNMSIRSAPTDAGKTYTVLQGVLDDFSVDSQSAARTFSGSVLDAWSGNAANLSTQLYSGIRTGTAIGLILDAAGWTGGRTLDPGATVIPWWWEEGTDPASAIDKLIRSEGWPAIAYVHTGNFIFRDRHHRIRNTLSNTSQGLFSQIVPAGTGPGYDYKVEKDSFEYDHGLKSIFNSVTFSVDQRKPTDVIEVWASEDPISMVAGEVRTIFVEPSDPAFNANTPSTSNGDIQNVGGTFSAVIDRTSGQKFIMTITCSGTGVITRLALRANSLPVLRTVQVQSIDYGSKGRYRESRWPGDAGWANAYDAQAIGDKTVVTFADNRPRISFTLVAFNDRYTSMMHTLRISDRITVRNDVLGVNGDFQIERLEPSVERWQVHRLKVSCVRADPLQPTNALTFDVAGKGFDQGSFVANGIDNPASMFVFDQAGQGFDQGLFAT